MKKLTQTVTASAENGWAGNCWQTCVAMLLDVDPETLPPQADCDLYTTKEDGTRGFRVDGTPCYNNRLQSYLRKHHGLTYMELHIPTEGYSQLRITGPHMMTGLTVRSASMAGMRHVVVGRDGEMVWDPHPSHAGLLAEIHWAFLAPYPKLWADDEVRRNRSPDPCACPACAKESFAVAT